MAMLDDPLTINGMRVRNRLGLPPITTSLGTTEGEVTEASLGFYRQRSRHVGLVVVEATAVRADGRIVPWGLGLWNDGQVPGMAGLARAIKAEGAVAVVQLNHAGARGLRVSEGIPGASPSGIAFKEDVEATALSEGQIAELVRDFAWAARRAREAGFDGVEVHGAHLYLLSQFLSPLTNQRADRYGGDAAGRATFPVEVVRAVRQGVGRDFPVLFRLNAVENIEGGQGLEDSIVAARRLKEGGVDAFDVSAIRGGWRETNGRRYPQGNSAFPKDVPGGANVPNTARIKQTTGLPVIAVGKLGHTLGAARTAVAEDMVDVAAVGRQMIADPEAAGKILSGREEEIIRCKECLTCFASFPRGPLKCSVNGNVTGKPAYNGTDN